jgi:hypothetical protein
MRQFLFGTMLIFAFALLSVKADVAPYPPAPPPPSGPDKAVIRGIAVRQVYTYWRGRKWMSVIEGCASSQRACNGKDLSECFIVGVDGQYVPSGDIAFLLEWERSAGVSSIRLTLDHCSLKEIELNR